MKEEFVLFWDGPFSQWCKSTFMTESIYVGTEKYTCAEQYMMSEKALFFKDFETRKEIMSTDNPRIQKELGRKVKGFNAEEWSKVAKQIVFRGNLAKFTQNPELKRALMETGTKTIVEASPYDTIWGIGLGEEDPRALDRATWKGLNWLGEVVTDVREFIKIKDKYEL